MATDGLYADNAGAVVGDGQRWRQRTAPTHISSWLTSAIDPGAMWVRSVIERSASKQLQAMPWMTSAHSA